MGQVLAVRGVDDANGVEPPALRKARTLARQAVRAATRLASVAAQVPPKSNVS
jgi:hypothetical protein